MNILNLEPENYNEEAKQLLCSLGRVWEWEDGDFPRGDFQVCCLKLGITVDDTFMERYPSLRYLLTPTTGLTHIDMQAAAQRGIEVISLKGETTFLQTITTTAEHTWALLLTLSRRMLEISQDVRQGNWQRKPFIATELRGKTLGIIGCGRLGSIVARYGVAFGMNVKVYDKNPNQPEKYGFVNSALEDLLATSDVVSLHIPYELENAGFFDKACFRKMKSGAWFLNTSRGEVIDEEALLQAMVSGHLSGAGLDVLKNDSSWTETIPKGHPLLAYAQTHPNLVITPHTGGYAREAIESTRSFIISKFLTQLQNLPTFP